MTDHELIEDAAKAAGLKHIGWILEGLQTWDSGPWNPLTYSGDAFELAVTLRMSVMNTTIRTNILVRPRTEFGDWIDISEPHGDDPLAATRRAIVRAAAAIGKEMK
jgi:hypothetical protein